MKRPSGFDAGHPGMPPAEDRAPSSSTRDRSVTALREPDSETKPIPIVRTRRHPSEPTSTTASTAPSGSGRPAPRPATDSDRGPAAVTRAQDRRGARRTAAAVRQAARGRAAVMHAEMRRFTGAARRRRLVWMISVGIAVILAGGVAAVSYSPLFAVRSIVVTGTSRLDPHTVSRALDNQLGTPLPAIDQAAVRRDLAQFRLIASYSIESRPPGTLVVNVIERVPIASVRVSGGYRLVDAAGVTITRSTARSPGFPLVAEPAGTRGFTASVAVLAALPPAVLRTVDRVSADTTDDVTLRLSSGKQVVWGGPDHGSLKAADLSALIASGVEAGTYDVSSPEAPVTR